MGCFYTNQQEEGGKSDGVCDCHVFVGLSFFWLLLGVLSLVGVTAAGQFESSDTATGYSRVLFFSSTNLPFIFLCFEFEFESNTSQLD